MKVKSSKDTKMKRLGAEELVELGKYRLSKGRSTRKAKGSKKKKWCVLDLRLKKRVKCYVTQQSAISEYWRLRQKEGVSWFSPKRRYEVVKGKK